jgi:predicted kinase
MSKKLIVLCGISGSGKSHFAHNEWLKDPLNTVVVNRDKIRELLFGFTEESIADYYSLPDMGKLEKQVTLYEDTLIHEGLNLDKTVIVDATHLTAPYLRRFQFWNVPIEYKYFDIALKVAIERDANRTRKVGEEVIKKQFDRYLGVRNTYILPFEPVEFKQDETLPPCIIYDVDGTIAKMEGRSAFDWGRVGEDKIISNVTATIDWTSEVCEGNRPEIIICTGRDGVALEDTERWLDAHNIYWDEIYIRDVGDQRPDWVIKEEIWREIAKRFYIVGMYDDRNQVTRRARALGLKVFQVEYGNF